MAINKKLIHFKNKDAFDRELQAGNILDTSICFVPDAKFIYTRGSYWYCPYSKDQIDALIAAVQQDIPTKVGNLENDANYQTDTQVEARIQAIIDSAPEALDTLKELADALNNDPDFSVTVANELGKKLNKSEYTTDKATFATKEELNQKQDSGDYATNSQLTEGLNSKLNATTYAQDKLTFATKTELTSHTGNQNNPHNVTKSQIGLGNVDNTSDANKPISTATQTALDTLEASIQAETERAQAAEEEIRATSGGGSSSIADGGDIAIVPFYRQAELYYTLVSENDVDTVPLAIYVMSYNTPYINKPINRIKMMIATPGRCRVSLLNEHIFDANPTEEECVVKDLVNVQCTATGYHYWDLDEDIVVGENQFIGAWFTGDCARYTYTSDLTFETGYPSGWSTRRSDSGQVTVESQKNLRNLGLLNIGLYRRGEGSDFSYYKLDESANSPSSPVSSYFPVGQEMLVGKTIYKLKLNIAQTGKFTVIYANGTLGQPLTLKKQWTFYIRQLGVQTLRLPEDLTFEEGDVIGVHGEGDEAKFYYGGSVFGTKYGKNGFYTYSDHNLNSTAGSGSTNLNVEIIKRGSRISSLEDKTISIQGDSISTFAGTITDGNAMFYSTSHKFVNNMDATWWGLLVNECRMRLIRNDAWSGSRISGTGNNAMCSTTRCNNLRNTSSTNNYPYGSPEIIVIMCGINDINGNVSLGTIDDTGTDTYMGAFKTMLQRIKTTCGNAKVVVFQLYSGNSFDKVTTSGTHQYEYHEAMEKICKMYGCYFVGPEHFNFQYPWINELTCNNNLPQYGAPSYSGADCLHPNVQGMERVYAGIRAYLEKLY